MKQHQAVDNPIACMICEEYPSLANVRTVFGEGKAGQWLCAQLVVLCEFCGVKEKLNGTQLTELADIFIHRYFFLKVTEFMLFFQYVKEGRYGKFYGSVDPQRLLSFMHDFIRERNCEIEKDNQRKKELERQKHSEGCVTHRQYCEMYGLDPKHTPFDSINSLTDK